MRFSLKSIVVCGEVILFGLLAAAVVRGGDYPPYTPTYLQAKPTSEVSPYAAQRPTRVTLTNQLGQTSTLEYHRPVKIVDDSGDDMIPIESLPIVSLPARSEDFVPQTRVQQASYQYQANYPAAPQIRYAGQPQSLPVVQTANCAPPTVMNYARPSVVNYPPATQYDLPNYTAPITTVPRTAYYPMQAPIVPIVQSDLQVGTGIYGQPVIYRPGQPVRNVWRWLTP